MIYEKDFKNYYPDKYQNPLFKLHGSLKRFENGKWVDTRNSTIATIKAVGQSGEEMIFEPGKRDVLNQILQNHDLYILGYSGFDDFDIGPILKGIQSNKKIIWIKHDRGANISLHSWEELEKAKKEGDKSFVDNMKQFWRKREEYLYEIGTSARNSGNVLLFDINTAKVVEMINEKVNSIPTTEYTKLLNSKNLKDIYYKSQKILEIETFYSKWEKNHAVNNQATKYNIVGRASCRNKKIFELF